MLKLAQMSHFWADFSCLKMLMAVELELLDQTRIFNVARTKHPWKKVKRMIQKRCKKWQKWQIYTTHFT